MNSKIVFYETPMQNFYIQGIGVPSDLIKKQKINR